MKPHGFYMNEHYNELVLLDSTCDRTIIICTSNCDKTSNILVKTILIIVIAKIISC